MSLNRRSFHRTLIAAVIGTTAATGAFAAEEGGLRSGHIFTSTNSAAGNEVLVFGTDDNGTLALQSRFSTQGLGTSAGLGSQGAVTLSGDGRWLFVVNAGSNSISTFAVRPAGLRLVSVQDSGGLRPISVAENEGLVYVLNADGAGNVAGFRNQQGSLVPVAGSVRPLSAAGGTGPAQVGIAPDGDTLLVTEKNTAKLTSYAIAGDGSAGAPVVTASSGATPFGFAFDRRGRVFVTEAPGSSLSSYRFDGATPKLVSASVPNGQAAACWAAVSPNGRFAFTANAGSGNVSSYAIARDGSVTLLEGAAGSTGANSGPVDMAMPRHGRSLAVLAGRAATVANFSVAADGTLTPAGTAAGLAGMAGLAAN